MGSPGKITGMGCHALLLGWDLPNPGIKPRSPALQAGSLPAELPEKPYKAYRLKEYYDHTIKLFSNSFFFTLRMCIAMYWGIASSDKILNWEVYTKEESRNHKTSKKPSLNRLKTQLHCTTDSASVS